MKKYAIFGGSFDPPHICHEKIVELCLNELGVDKIFVIPTFLSPFKSSFTAPPDIRYAWLKKIFETFGSKVEVLDIEIKKQRSVYMIETVEDIAAKIGKQSYDKIYLIIGSDNLKDFDKWHRHKELIGIAEPVVISRGGVSSDNYKTIKMDCDISSTAFRDKPNEMMIPLSVRNEVVDFYKGKF